MVNVRIRIASRKLDIVLSEGELQPVLILGFWLVGWSVGGGFLLNRLINVWFSAINPFEGGLLLVASIPMFFICCGSVILMAIHFGITRLLTVVFTSESELFGTPVLTRTTLRLTAETLTITRNKLWRTLQSHAYPLNGISNLRLAQHSGPSSNAILFDHNSQTVICCEGLPLQEALHVLRWLLGALRFRCHSVERIVFSASESDEHDSQHTLWNPDMSALTIPCTRLKQLWVVTDGYDILLLERFFTYATSVLGQKYMKQHLEVHIHGELSQLHPNLQNLLTNSCRSIHVHQEKTSGP